MNIDGNPIFDDDFGELLFLDKKLDKKTIHQSPRRGRIQEITDNYKTKITIVKMEDDNLLHDHDYDRDRTCRLFNLLYTNLTNRIVEDSKDGIREISDFDYDSSIITIYYITKNLLPNSEVELLLEEILLINDIFFIELETHNFYKNMTGYGYGSKKVGYKFIKEKYELNKNNREDFNFTKYYDSYHEEERQLCYNLKPKRIRESIKKKIINDNDVRKLYPFY